MENSEALLSGGNVKVPVTEYRSARCTYGLSGTLGCNTQIQRLTYCLNCENECTDRWFLHAFVGVDVVDDLKMLHECSSD